jgi:hypothetical protein
VQRPGIFAAPERPIGQRCSRQRASRIDMNKSVVGAIALGKAVQMGLGQRLRGQGSAAKPGGGFQYGQIGQIVRHRASGPVGVWSSTAI